MFFDIQTLALINLIVQLLLMVTVFVAAYLAKAKRQLIRHCTIMRVAIPVQIVSIAAVMLPSMLGYIESGHISTWPSKGLSRSVPGSYCP